MATSVEQFPLIKHGLSRFRVTPLVELLVLLTAIAIFTGSYFIVVGGHHEQRLLTPPLVALLLIANLVPGIALLVLLGRRIAKRRAAQSPVGGGGQLHVRLVGLFSIMAAVPMLLVTIFASLLFQYGVEFWFSDRARGMLENASLIAHENYELELARVGREVTTMSGDLAGYLQQYPIDSQTFARGLFYQTYRRELSEAIIIHITPDNHVNSLALLDPYDRDLEKIITPKVIAQIRKTNRTLIIPSIEAPGALSPLNYGDNDYLYATHVFDPHTALLLRRGEAIVADYHALLVRSRSLQVKFNAALLIISLLIVAIAVWIALAVADRLVRPVGELVDAARRIEGGDLTARVAVPNSNDEVGTLSNAFNQMVGTLQEQTTALVTANDQLDSRRALIEAVMSGVTAGVIAIGPDRRIRLINSSAQTLLNAGAVAQIGRPLASLAPELDALLDGDGQDAIVQVTAGEPKTLAVKITGDATGQVLTFDDITQQLLDQRRAAWSDVARRIAHEIKNPLTPIQLAAERLQRRYGKQFEGADATFSRLTDTIVRQVGDLRRMVDEFSSFARMPKPIFRPESLVDIGRQALFLHEVAHANVRFSLDYEEPMPALVCDRRQIGQALTNLVKNAVEAIEARGEGASGEVMMTITGQAPGIVTIAIADDGVGLPAERSRLVEPYMTTRARGTGLGLAIVKKIAEEHFGSITFDDRPGGGTIVTMRFDAAMLAALEAPQDIPADRGEERRPTALTPNRKK
jgi:two-component system nitrogen regulation sensor histidine kinase NtrY